MFIKILAENTAIDDCFECEHGLSLYIETQNHQILFDFGQTDLMFKNAEKLGIDLAKIDIAIISHSHNDHTGGLKKFLKINKTAKIYLNQNAKGEFFSKGNYIGIDRTLLDNDRIIFTSNELKIDEELFLFTGNKLKRNHVSYSFQNMLKDGKLVQDTYEHEQYLLIKEDAQTSLISGCSHKGVLNILDFSKNYNINNLIGGFHLKDLKENDSFSPILDELSDKLMSYNDVNFYTCHCTGTPQFNTMKKTMKNRLNYISTGQTIKI